MPGTIRAGGSEQLYSGAALSEVATGLSIAIFSLLGVGHDWPPDEPPSGQTSQSLMHGRVSDPVLQNFCLTAIVIGVAVTAVLLTIAVRAAQHYRSVDADELTALHG